MASLGFNGPGMINKTAWISVDNVILVGGAITIWKNMKVNGKDDIPYIKENKNVPNHQPVYQMICNIGGVSTIEAEDCGL